MDQSGCKIHLMEMSNKTKLKKLIEEKISEHGLDLNDQPLFICKVSDVSPSDILGEGYICIFDDCVYYCAHESRVHSYTSLVLTNVLSNAFKPFSDEWAVQPIPIPLVNIFKCGKAQYKTPDGVLGSLDNYMDFPLAFEVGFSHETRAQLLYELVHLLTKYTNTVYAIGMKVSYDPTNFFVEITVIQRLEPIDQESIEYLRNTLKNNELQTPFCVKQTEINSFHDITPEKFNANVIYHFYINDTNIDDDIKFTLDGNCINEPTKSIDIIISSKYIKILRKLWEEHFKRL